MTITSYLVSGMTCGHCVSAVTDEIGKLDGVTGVEVDLVRAPSLGRRIEDVRAVRLLESLDEVGHRVRSEAGHPPPVGVSVAEDRP